MSELRALTAMRGIAAWGVVFYHIRGSIPGLPHGLEAVFAKGYLAVDFFFLLSGFVIWLTWHDRLAKERAVAGAGAGAGVGMGGVARFLQKRVARIWPLHAVMLGSAVALALLLRASGRDDPAFPFAELPLHVLLIQNWGFTRALHWNDPAWSISCELAAYLLFPLLIAAVDWRRRHTAVLVAAAAALLVTLHLLMGRAGALGDDIPRYGLIRCLTEFATGTILAALFLRRPPTAIVLGVAVAGAAGWAWGAPETLAAPATFAALLLALALTSGAAGHPLEGRWLHALGEVSYATYLSHFLIWKVFKLVAVRDAAAVPFPSVALYLAIVLVASVLLYRWVERPAQRWINAWPRPGRPATARPPGNR